MNFNTIPEALEDLRQGKIILVTDDPDRENEGDFICAAEFATTENINFMATHGKGLICMPMSEAFVRKLQFPQMVQNNTDNHETGLHGVHRPHFHLHRHLRRRALRDGDGLRGGGREGGGFPPTGPYVPAAVEEKRRVGAGGPYGGHR